MVGGHYNGILSMEKSHPGRILTVERGHIFSILGLYRRAEQIVIVCSIPMLIFHIGIESGLYSDVTLI